MLIPLQYAVLVGVGISVILYVETLLPVVTEASRNSVVILRLRGRTDLGTTFMDVLLRYAQTLAEVASKLVVVSTNERIDEQLGVTGITAVIGAENVYAGDHRVGAAIRRAHDDAVAWVAANQDAGSTGPG